MTKKTYYVTETAGAFVAGVRNPGPGKPLLLTEAQAEHELIAGHLSEEQPTPLAPVEAKPAPKPGKAGN